MSHQFLNFNEHSSFSDILRYNWTVRQWIRTWIYPDFEIPQLGALSRRLECNWYTVNSRWETWPIWSLGPPDQIWKCGSRHSKRSSSRGKIVMIASWIYGYPFFLETYRRWLWNKMPRPNPNWSKGSDACCRHQFLLQVLEKSNLHKLAQLGVSENGVYSKNGKWW